MNTWYEVNVRYIKMDENGRERKASETYLLDAVSCTEAEARITKELETMISGEFSVTKIAKTNISEIIPSEDGDRWFKGKVGFITVDETSGKEKRITQNILVFANNIDEADNNIKSAMQGMMCDFVIVSISESKIVDVFPYLEAEKVIPKGLKPLESFVDAEGDDVYPIKLAVLVSDASDVRLFKMSDGNWADADRPGVTYEDSEVCYTEL